MSKQNKLASQTVTDCSHCGCGGSGKCHSDKKKTTTTDATPC